MSDAGDLPGRVRLIGARLAAAADQFGAGDLSPGHFARLVREELDELRRCARRLGPAAAWPGARRNARELEWRGERLSLAQWSRRVGLSPAVINRRLSRGWSTEAALTTPPRRPDGGQFLGFVPREGPSA